MLERRKFVRLNTAIGVVYKLVKKHRRLRPQSSFIENISGGGVRLRVKEDVRTGDLLELDIQIPHLREPVHAIGEIVWYSVVHDRGEEIRKAGVRFRDMAADDLKCVLEYIHAVGIG